MSMCKNVGCGFVLIIEFVYEIVMKNQFNVVGVIGYIDVYLNFCNIILGKVVFMVDMWMYFLDKFNVMVDEFMEKVLKFCEEIGVEFFCEIVG